VSAGGEGLLEALSIDFADPEGGVAGLARVESTPGAGPTRALGVLVAGDGTWRSVQPDAVRIEDDGTGAQASLDAGRAGFEIEATRGGAAAIGAGTAFADATGLSQELFALRVAGRWSAGESGGRLDCTGTLARTVGTPDWNRIALLRSLSATLEDGSLLAIAAARPEGAGGHGEEAATAVLLDPEGAVTRFDDPLVSTEYDREGRPRRIGVELWGSDADGAPLRGAGTLIGPAADVALLRFTLDGTPGTASYELVGPAE
jgi:hypothetical protein